MIAESKEDPRVETIAGYIPGGSSVLDLGYRTQSLIDHLAPGCEYQACDLPRSSRNVILSDFSGGLFLKPVKKFTHVVCIGVLEYIRNHHRFLKECRLLGDVVILTYNLRRFGDLTLDCMVNNWVNPFSQFELEDEFRQAGFRAECLGTTDDGEVIYRLEPKQVDVNFRDLKVWKSARRIAIAPIRRFIGKVTCPIRRLIGKVTCRGRIPLCWYNARNWGDALNPVLVGLLSGRRAVYRMGGHHDRYLAVGSILGMANERAEVWGTGFARAHELLTGRPRAVHAVRGPLSRELLLKHGVDCPEVFGDPALLLPRFFNPNVAKRYAVGIVAHHSEKGHPWVEQFRPDPQVLIVDIESGTQEFVRSLKSCDVIVSSSLHGLICADAYGVPNAWLRLSGKVPGGNFKFRDYRLSIGAGEPTAISITEDTRLADVVAKAEQRELRIDLRKLILACPFLSDELRREVVGITQSTGALPLAFSSTQLEREEVIP